MAVRFYFRVKRFSGRLSFCMMEQKDDKIYTAKGEGFTVMDKKLIFLISTEPFMTTINKSRQARKQPSAI